MTTPATKTNVSICYHVRGPIGVAMSRNGQGPYAIIRAGDELVLFPDREALDTLIEGATDIRDMIDKETGRQTPAEQVRRVDDDRPVPVYGTVIARLDDEWAAVRWDDEKAPTIEALDELTGAGW